MNPIIVTSNNPLNCSKHEYIKDAFCISHKLFDKNNTCIHEPIKQTCYVHQEMSRIPQKNDECYEGFYARCHVNDYRRQIENDICVSAESSLMEWCTCKKTANRTDTALTVQKDCTCFPHHTKPYKIFKLKEENEDNSCVCTNIYRKRCDFPKNRTVIHAVINCTTVNENLPMEDLMQCTESAYVKKVIEYSKKRANQIIKSDWTRLSDLKKQKLVDIRNKAKNATKKISEDLQIQTTAKTQEESSLPKQTQDLNKISKDLTTRKGKTSKPTVIKQFPLQETTNSLTENNNSVDAVEENFEREVSSLLTKFLGNKSYAEMDEILESLVSEQILYNDSKLVEEQNRKEKKMISNHNQHNISKKLLIPVASNDSTILNSSMISTFNNNYYHLKNYQSEHFLGSNYLSGQTKMLPFTLIICSLILIFIGCFLFKKIKKNDKYSKLEKTVRSEREVREEGYDSLDPGRLHTRSIVNSAKKTLENNRRTTESAINTFKNSVLYVKDSNSDKELLIVNEEIAE